MVVASLHVIAGLLFLPFLSAGTCKKLYCPEITTRPVGCDHCHLCLEQSVRYCATIDGSKCACSSGPSTCKKEPEARLLNYTFCHLLDDAILPSPVVSQRTPHAISVVVPRFFNEAPFKSIKPSFLYLLASFNKTKCEPIGNIESFVRPQGQCLYRIRLHLPGIDVFGHNDYYYDDRTPIESEFSLDIFGGNCTEIKFWAETTIRKSENITAGSVDFATVLRSESVIFKPQTKP